MYLLYLLVLVSKSFVPVIFQLDSNVSNYLPLVFIMIIVILLYLINNLFLLMQMNLILYLVNNDCIFHLPQNYFIFYLV